MSTSPRPDGIVRLHMRGPASSSTPPGGADRLIQDYRFECAKRGPDPASDSDGRHTAGKPQSPRPALDRLAGRRTRGRIGDGTRRTCPRGRRRTPPVPRLCAMTAQTRMSCGGERNEEDPIRFSASLSPLPCARGYRQPASRRGMPSEAAERTYPGVDDSRTRVDPSCTIATRHFEASKARKRNPFLRSRFHPFHLVHDGGTHGYGHDAERLCLSVGWRMSETSGV